MHENSPVPDFIQPDEKLVRLIFSPFHLNKSKSKLTPNAFRPPAGRDEVSVTRLKFTTADFCKRQGKTMEQEADESSSGKLFFGFGVVNFEEIVDAGAGLRVSKLPENPFHADIFYGILSQKGQPLPAELNEKMKRLTDSIRYYPDPNREAQNWQGEELV